MPMDESLTPPVGEKPLSRLAVAKDLTDLLSKAVPLIAGTIYLIGYFVIAGHLADYDVPVTQLVNAQYFIAGLPPGVLLLLTLVVGYSAYRYNPQGEGGKAQSRVGFLVVALFLVLLVIEIASGIVNRLWNLRILGTESWFDLYVVTLFRAVLGQAALWYLIVGLRTRLFAQLGTYFSAQGRSAADAYMFLIYLLVMAAVMIYGSYKAMAQVYSAIPQAYGGARSLRVQLYVEREKIPLELLATNSGGEKTAMVYTVPVEMVFRASDAFIVSTVSNGARRVWTLDARIVHAVLSSPKALAGPVKANQMPRKQLA